MDHQSILPTILGRDPYCWQRDLCQSLVDGDIPGSLDIPTGLGKTAIIAIWLAAKLSGASLPRRLVYVVDRRAVVDQATTEAIAVAAKLEQALNTLSPDQAEIWRRNLCLDSNRIPISTLRGQFADNRNWLRSPVQSSIIVGTVDMIGSRILFEGYGVNPRMRSVHAALLGSDSLVVIDEAHLVPPFKLLMQQVARVARPSPVPAMQVIALSATGRAESGENVFHLTTDHRDDLPVRLRLAAPKKVALHETTALAKSLGDRAFELGRGGGAFSFSATRETSSRVSLPTIFESEPVRNGKTGNARRCSSVPGGWLNVKLFPAAAMPRVANGCCRPILFLRDS